MRIKIIDKNPVLLVNIVKWAQKFNLLDIISTHEGNPINYDADAVVSPANSFGFMDGGIDWVYTQHFGILVQERVQEKIKTLKHKELLVGDAIIVPTDNEKIKYLICAPTMRVPVNINFHAINVFLASRAAIYSAREFGLNSVIMPGCGTGVGAVEYNNAAFYMVKGIDEALNEKSFPKSIKEAYEDQFNL